MISDVNCSEVKCEKEELCPSDSYRLPNHKSVEACCSVPQACVCLPGPCPSIDCEPGTWEKVIRPGSGKPGACCPVYKCVANGKVCHDSKMLACILC